MRIFILVGREREGEREGGTDGWMDGWNREREKEEKEGGGVDRLVMDGWIDGWIWRLMDEWMDV